MPPAIPVIVAIAASSAVTAALVGTAFAAAIGTIGVSVLAGTAAMAAASLASSALGLGKLGGSPNFTAEAKERSQVIRSAIASHKIIYGETITSGPLVFATSTGDKNEFLHMVIPLAGHEVEAITDVYFNDERVLVSEIDGSGNVLLPALRKQISRNDERHRVPTSSKAITLDDIPDSIKQIRVLTAQTITDPTSIHTSTVFRWVVVTDFVLVGSTITFGGSVTGGTDASVDYNFSESNIRVKKHLGTATQVADSDLVSEVKEWTTDHRLLDIAYIYVRLEFDADVFPNGIPNVKAVVRGRKVFDPRSSTTVFSDNWALCVRDYLTAQFGLRADSTEVNDASFIAAANSADESTINHFSPNWVVQTNAGFTWNQGWLVKKDGVEGVYDAGTVSKETITTETDSVSNLNGQLFFLLDFDKDNGDTDREFGLGLSTSASSIDPDDFEFSWRCTDFVLGTFTYTMEVFESGVSKFSTTVVSDGSTSNDLEIRVDSGATVKYYINDVLQYTSLASPTFPLFFASAFKDTFADVLSFSEKSIATQKRYTCNGAVDTDNKPNSILEQMTTAGAGAVTYTQGEYKLKAGVYNAAVITLNEDNLRSAIKVRPRISRRELFNAVRGTYLSASNFYQATDFPAITNATFATQDGDEVIYRDIELPYTNTSYEAQRIAKIHLEKSRQGITVDFPANLSALELSPFDNVKLNIDQLGWVNKEFVIISWRLSSDGGVDLVLQEEASASYDWNHGEATAIDPAPDTNLPDSFNIGPVTSLTFSADIYRVRGSGLLTWIAPNDTFLFDYRVTIADTEGRLVNDIKTRDTSILVPDLDAAGYIVTVYATNVIGSTSPGEALAINIDVAALPPRVSGLELDLGGEGGQAHSNQWTGKDVKIKWRAAGISESFEIGSEAYGASSGFIDWYFKDYEVEVFDGSNKLLRVEFLTDISYTYTFEKNAEDFDKLNNAPGTNRTLTFKVFARGRQNQRSAQPAIL
jgi:hypothetical protein